MANIWKPQSIDVYKSWIEALNSEASDELTTWEVSFIESLTDRLDKGMNLTERQAEVLEKIYTEKTE